MLFRLTPEMLIANLIVLLVAMTVHEFAHNYGAYIMGDHSADRRRRLTLDPRMHINWIGFLMFALIGFGFLGSAPYAPYRMRNPRWGTLVSVAAGPLSNLLLAIIFGIIIAILPNSVLTGFFGILLTQMVFLNVLLFVFNLLPLFPIDGWYIVLALLPADLATVWQRHQQTSQFVFIGLLLLSFVNLPGFPDIFSLLIGEPTFTITRFLLGF